MSKPLRSINIRIFSPGNKSWTRLFIRAPKGRAFNDQGEDYVLKNIAERVEHAAPLEEYALRKVGRGEYNFVHIGKAAVPEVA